MSFKLIQAATRMASKNAGSIANIGFNGYFAYDGYTTARDSGSGVVSSAISGLTDAALPMMMGMGAYLGMQAVIAAPGAAVSAIEGISQYGRGLQKQSRQTPFQNSQFAETQQTYTMRQAGMTLAQKSKYNLQQTMLGNEAQHMHR
jgi:hypothetical protein